MLIAAFAIGACSDATGLSGGSKGDSKKKDEEDEQADDPVQVSGAYLICDWVETKKTESGLTTTIGCTVVDSNGTAFPREDRSFQLSLYDDSKKKVDMVTSDPSAASSFHKLALLPSEYNETGYLEMTMRKGSKVEGRYPLSTVDIGNSVAFGSQVEGDPINPTTADSIKLKAFTRHGLWNGDGFGWALGYAVASEYCKNGIVSGAISQEYQDLINTFKINADATLVDPSIKKETVETDPDTCFYQFKMKGTKFDKESAKEWAHSYDNCFFLKSGPLLYIVSKTQTTNPDVTLENLKQHAQFNQCK